MPLYATTIFLSAFLLFQVQPVIARAILPWFGGSAAVWTTCMLFFQAALLLGYLYAHWSTQRLNPRWQTGLHLVLLAASLLLLPITPDSYWKPTGGENPTLGILLLLAATVGLPYFLLSTTSPLMQVWYSRGRGGAIPYRLFALSNLGSMLALLSYPSLVEPLLATRRQSESWSVGYVLFAALCAWTALRGARGQQQVDPGVAPAGEETSAGPSAGQYVFWAALAACPSMLMLAITNHLTQDVAAIPFLWILPLTIYLLSFILCFDASRWYWRPGFLAILPVALAGMTWLLSIDRDDINMRLTITLFAAAFLVCCMVCHGELARRKPHPSHLTAFYLMLSVGGVAGGLLVGVIAPAVFPNYFEFPIAVGLCALLGVAAVWEDSLRERLQTWLLPVAVVTAAGVISLFLFLGRAMWDSVANYKLVARNFYGSLRVREHGKKADDWDGYRSFLHGAINHGEQWTHPQRRRELLTYYCDDTGVGRAMKLRRPGVEHRVGVLGLGAGTMAAFSRAGDYYHFYEINPLVLRIANQEFTFLKDSPARVDVAFGDARLSMEREPLQNFDVLVMDAFSGDSIPVHLVTREALLLYFRHLKPDGVLAVHISNKYLNLQPVIERLSAALNKTALVIETDDSEDGNCFGTTWVVMASRREILESPEFRASGVPPKPKPGVGVWTDDYSNLYRILK